MKSRINRIMMMFFFTISVIIIFINNPLKDNLINFKNFLVLLILFVLIHFFKCLRQYLLFIESKVGFSIFFRSYIKTTFCSIILPYKLGELYKLYEYGYICNNYMKGFLMVVVDKLFDAVLLLMLFIPYEFRTNHQLSKICVLLLTFVLLFFVIYVCFNTTYYYLNKHFIRKKSSNRDIVILKVLEQCNNLYIYINDMLKGKTLLFIMFTILAWLFEYLFIHLLNGGNIIDYINSVFFGFKNVIYSNYVIIGIVCFITIAILLFIRRRYSEK